MAEIACGTGGCCKSLRLVTTTFLLPKSKLYSTIHISSFLSVIQMFLVVNVAGNGELLGRRIIKKIKRQQIVRYV